MPVLDSMSFARITWASGVVSSPPVCSISVNTAPERSLTAVGCNDSDCVICCGAVFSALIGVIKPPWIIFNDGGSVDVFGAWVYMSDRAVVRLLY